METLTLRDLCGTRAGDKGDTVDLSLFAYDWQTYTLIREQITAERVREHFSAIASGPVHRFEAPNVLALKFVLESALGGGASRSLRSDNLGKTLGGALLRLTVAVPPGVQPTLKPRPDLNAAAARVAAFTPRTAFPADVR